MLRYSDCHCRSHARRLPRIQSTRDGLLVYIRVRSYAGSQHGVTVDFGKRKEGKKNEVVARNAHGWPLPLASWSARQLADSSRRGFAGKDGAALPPPAFGQQGIYSMSTTRRRFLQTVAGAAALGLPDVPFFAELAALAAEPPPATMRFGPDIEPVVRLIEDTPRERCVSVFLDQLRRGVLYRRF